MNSISQCKSLIPHYEMSSKKDFLEDALEAHVSTLTHSYFEEPKPKLMLFFSGIPGMGKTTISKYLEVVLHGIRLSNDESRRHLRKALQKEQALDAEIKLSQHITNLIVKIESLSKNHLLIMDSSIDGDEEKAKDLAHSHGYALFVIRLNASQETVVERLSKREQDPSILISRLDKWWGWYNSFDINFVDYFLDTSADFEALDLNSLLEAIHKKLQNLG